MTKLFITIVLCVIPFTTFAQINLGQIFEKAEKGDARAQYKLGEYYLSKKNYQQAILWLQKATTKNNNAKILLGEMYENSYGMTKDWRNERKAFDLYNQAATDGDGNGLYKLALCYFKGIGTIRDEQKGVENLKKAASTENIDAKVEYGLALEKGIYGLTPDLESSFQYIYDAAIEGNKKAIDQMFKYEQYNNINIPILKKCLADVMFRGVQELEQAEILYKEAISLGNMEAAAKLGYMYCVIDHTDSEWPVTFLGYAEKAVEHDKRMKFRTNKKFTDTDNAPYWIEKALKEGITHVNICGFERECAVSLHLCLYLLYSHKFHEVISAPIDYKKAYDNLKIYADYYDDHTLDEPKLSMADLQYLGEFDLEKAFSTYFYFANNDDIYGWGSTGTALCYYYGKGIKKDYESAVKYINKALELGNDSDAMVLLSKCYRYGRGVKMDNAKAEYWYNKALENHNPGAMSLQKQREKFDLVH